MSETVQSTLPRNLEMATILGMPILTDAEKLALFSSDDHGVTPVIGLGVLSNFWAWQERGGFRNNFYRRFADGINNDVFRASQCFQRFEILHPELKAELSRAANVYQDAVRASAFAETYSVDWSNPQRPDIPTPRIPEYDEDLDKKFFGAHQILASLVDVNDFGIQSDRPLPGGAQVDWNLLVG